MLGEPVAALAGPYDQARLLQVDKPIVDPGLLPPGRHHELGDGEPGRAGVGQHGQQPGDLRVAVARLGRRPAARAGRSRVGVAAACGRGRRVAARAGVGGGVAGGRLGGDRVQAGGGVGVVGGQLVDLGGGGQKAAGGPGTVKALAAGAQVELAGGVQQLGRPALLAVQPQRQADLAGVFDA